MKNIVKKLLRESLMNEKSILDVSLMDFNIKEIIDSWLMSSSETPVMMFKYEMQDEYNLSPEEKEHIMDMDEDEILESDRFKKWLKYEAEYKIENFISEIQDYFNGDTITIWREMTVPMDWVKGLSKGG